MEWLDSPLWDKIYFGNTLANCIWFASILLFGLLFKRVLSKIFSFTLFKLFKKVSGNATANEFHELLKKPFSVFMMLLVGYLAVIQLEYPWGKPAPESRWHLFENFIATGFSIAVIASITWILLRVVDFFGLILYYRAAKTESKLDDQLVPFFRDGLKILVVILSFFFTLASIFDVNVVTLIGGLGIGGLAVALAAKETLENLLGSFTIFLDKPFTVGDQIKVGNVSGHVESIGLRSTRIRTLEKSLITMPNKKMVDAELENITERTMWRVRFTLGLNYSTNTESLSKITLQIRSLLESNNMIDANPVVRFETFGQSSLDILISYMVKTSAFDEMIAVRENLNFEIMRIVQSNGGDFALQTPGVQIEKPVK